MYLVKNDEIITINELISMHTEVQMQNKQATCMLTFGADLWNTLWCLIFMTQVTTMTPLFCTSDPLNTLILHK